MESNLLYGLLRQQVQSNKTTIYDMYDVVVTFEYPLLVVVARTCLL